MKKFLFIQHQAPHKSISGQEGLDAILMGSAFVECSVLLMDDGIYQVLANQKTQALGVKDYAVSYKALADYGVNNIYCCQSHLDKRKLSQDDLLLDVQCLSDDETKDLFKAHDLILSF